MLGLFKTNPIKKLQKKHKVLMERAVEAQRNGKLELYANLISEAETIFNEIKQLEKKSK